MTCELSTLTLSYRKYGSKQMGFSLEKHFSNLVYGKFLILIDNYIVCSDF